MQREQLRINSGIVAYAVKGKGNPIVLLHGFMESMDIWEDYCEALSTDYRVITIDLPGHGETSVSEVANTMGDMADLVHVVLTHLGIRSFCLIGHSMGGYVALEFAARFPEMLTGMCLFHSNANEDSPEAKLNRSRAISIVQQDRTGFITRFIPDLFAPENRPTFAAEIQVMQQRASSMTADAIIAALEGMKIRRNHYDTLKNIDVPVCFIVGQKDTRMDMVKMQEQVLLPEQSTVLYLRSCGHMGYLENRDECLRAILGLQGEVVLNL
jgi:pimeloyl-ACP methyl ester carboxylesterase